ncbi:MAG TPA: ZIP family metal transporter [Candidatus Paceibacterota bacterium]|nr:ZIP family metal transporter [Candidatus Paceibacterota bacterium]
MTTAFILSMASVFAISAISLIGVFALSLKERMLRSSLFILVSLAAGALLGDAFVHLIPEAYAEAASPLSVSLAILAGVLGFFVIEKGLHWHHHQGIEGTEPSVHPIGKLILFSDGVHNFIDGLIIGASYLVSVEVGIATTIAVILHEIPQEIGDFGVLIHAGYTKVKALWFNFLSALASVFGAVLAFILGSSVEGLTLWLIPIAAGGFIYIALSDLIPELHKDGSLRHSALQFLWILIGIISMIALLGFEGEGHAHGADEAHIEEHAEEEHTHLEEEHPPHEIDHID